MKFTLRDDKGHVKAIIFDRDVAETVKWLYVKDKWTMELDAPKKVATLQQPIPSHSHDGVEVMRSFDATQAKPSTRPLSINVSYTVRHDVRHYIARHETHGTIRGETFNHDSTAHWFYQKIKTVWPGYTISKK